MPPRVRKDVEKYLLPGEQPVVVIRRHWAVLLEPTARWLPVFVVGVSLILLAPEHRVPGFGGMLLALGALVAYGLRVTEWWMRHFIVSRRRVLFTSGVIVRTVTLLPLLRITDLTWQETLLGQALGYGTFRFESAGQDQALRHLRFIPEAHVLYRQVSELLFSSDHGAAISGDDEGNPELPPAPASQRDTEPLPQLRHDTRPLRRLPPQRG